MAATIQRLKNAGIKFVGEDVKPDYLPKRKTMEQATKEVARQNRRDKAHDEEMRKLNETLDKQTVSVASIQWENHDPKESCPKCKGKLQHDKRCKHLLKCLGCGWRGNRWLL